jgi:hypothetical protein
MASEKRPLLAASTENAALRGSARSVRSASRGAVSRSVQGWCRGMRNGAVDQRLDRQVVIKVPHILLLESDFHSRFVHEIQSLNIPLHPPACAVVRAARPNLSSKHRSEHVIHGLSPCAPPHPSAKTGFTVGYRLLVPAVTDSLLLAIAMDLCRSAWDSDHRGNDASFL